MGNTLCWFRNKKVESVKSSESGERADCVEIADSVDTTKDELISSPPSHATPLLSLYIFRVSGKMWITIASSVPGARKTLVKSIVYSCKHLDPRLDVSKAVDCLFEKHGDHEKAYQDFSLAIKSVCPSKPCNCWTGKLYEYSQLRNIAPELIVALDDINSMSITDIYAVVNKKDGSTLEVNPLY